MGLTNLLMLYNPIYSIWKVKVKVKVIVVTSKGLLISQKDTAPCLLGSERGD